ncbi:hypothetical protein ABK040_016188 [Willaertia magna]
MVPNGSVGIDGKNELEVNVGIEGTNNNVLLKDEQEEEEEINNLLPLSKINDEEINDNVEGDDNLDDEKLEKNLKQPSTFKEKLLFHYQLMKAELIGIIEITWPTMLQNLSNRFIPITDLAFIGRLGERAMAACTLGNSITICFMFLALGLLSGQDTFLSQSFGAKNFKMVGVWLARSLITVMVCLIPCTLIIWFFNYPLLLIGLEPELVETVTLFLRLLVFSVFPFTIMRAISRFLISMSIRIPNSIIPTLAVFVNFVLDWLFIYGFGDFWFGGIGFQGAPIATFLTRLFMLLAYFVVLYHYREECKEVWKGFVDWKEVLQIKEIIHFLRLAIPGTITGCAEIWAFELTTVVCSKMPGTAYISAHAVISNLSAFAFMVPLALGVAATIRVGQMLGANQPLKAKYTSFTCNFLAAAFMLIAGSICAVLSKLLPKLFTNDPEVIELASQVLPLCSVFQLFDGVQTVSSGVLKGIGSQKIAAVANIVSYYVIGLPVGVLLAFVFGWNLMGLWVGLAVSLFFVSSLLFSYILFKVDWEKEAENAAKRIVGASSN